MLYLNFRIMSVNQYILLEHKCDDIQDEDLLDQSANSEEEPIEQKVVMLKEVQPADLGFTLVCSDKGIFTEVDLTNF